VDKPQVSQDSKGDPQAQMGYNKGMGRKDIFRGVVHQGDPGLQGRVSGSDQDPRHIKRRAEILSQMAGSNAEEQPSDDIQADTTDHYRGARFSGSVISLDNAAAFDEGVSDFAAGKDMTGHDGVLPCDVVGRPRDPGIGVSRKKKWNR
jgi:hypothetical protein